MSTVLYLDASPLLLSHVKRNARGRVLEGYVENGAWLLKLGTHVGYAFDKVGDELYLVHEFLYEHYEEYQVNTKGDYKTIIAAADALRKTKKE